MNNELPRYGSERCINCGIGLTWIEIAFGTVWNPICGKCLKQQQADVLEILES